MTELSPAEAIFFAALELTTAAERAAFLDKACAGDQALRRRVERLLAAHPQVGGFLERPVVEAEDLAALTPTVPPECDAALRGGQPGSGTETLQFGAAGTETVQFQNLAPVFDSVAGPLVVNGTNGDDAINYAVGFNTLANFLSKTPSVTWGQVSVNSLEPMEFVNKTSLTLNTLTGNDTINLNNPNTPTSLTGITVNGGGGTGTLTANANAAAGQAITFAPTSASAGSISGSGVGGAAPGVPITFSNIGQVEINGQARNDTLTVTTPAGGSVVNLTPGAVADAGTVTLRQVIGAGGSPLVGLQFVNLGINDAAGRLSFNNAGGRTDSLTINGVADASEIFTVAAAGTINLDQPVAAGTPNSLLLGVATPGVSELQLAGLAGNDTFNVAGNHPFTAGVFVDGNPGTLNFTGDGTALVTADLGARTVTETGFGAVAYTGVATANINVGGNSLLVKGTPGPNSFTCTPTGAAAGTVSDAGVVPTINFSGVAAAGTFTLDPGASGKNTVTVNGSPGSDLITVARGRDATTVQVNALQTVTLVTADTQALVINTGPGADTVNVAGAGGGGIGLTVQGGSPSAPDTLNVFNATPGTTVVVPTGAAEAATIYTPDGGIVYNGMYVVKLYAAGGGDTLQVNGTNVSDQIEVVQAGGDEVELDNLGILPFFGFGNLKLIGAFGNDQLLVATLPGVNVTIIGGGGGDGGGFANTLNFDPQGRPATLTPTSINVEGAPPVHIAGLSRINFLGSVVDVSALVRFLSVGKAKRVGKNRLKIHFVIEDFSALALGGPLVLIFNGLTGRAQVIGVGGLTTRFRPAGVGMPWVGVDEGPVPLIHSGQRIGFDVVFRTTHSSVSFNPFFAIAAQLP
jgi:hypothetical protein